MNPVEGSEPSVPWKTRSGKLISPSNRAATNNVLYILITLLVFGAEAREKAKAYCPCQKFKTRQQQKNRWSSVRRFLPTVTLHSNRADYQRIVVDCYSTKVL